MRSGTVRTATVRTALAKCSIFGLLDPQELDRALATIRYRITKHSSGTVIAVQGDLYEDLVVLISGEIDAFMQNSEGKNLLIETLNAPDVIAPGIVFAAENYLPVGVVAKTDVELLRLPKTSVVSLGKRCPDFFVAYLRDSGNKIVTLAAKLKFAQFKTIRQKIATYLLDSAQRERADRFALHHTKEQLAELFGVTRPALSRVFSQLTNAGIVCQKGKTVHILKKAALRDIDIEDNSIEDDGIAGD